MKKYQHMIDLCKMPYFIYFIHFLIFRTDGFSKVKLEKQTSHTQTIIKNVVCVTKDATHIIVMYFLVFYATKKRPLCRLLFK